VSQHGKRYRSTRARIDREKLYAPVEAIRTLKELEGAKFDEETIALSPGDWIILFSDGVSEALSAAGEEYGEGRIVACAQRSASLDPPGLLHALFADVREFTKGAAQSDDITAMVLQYEG